MNDRPKLSALVVVHNEQDQLEACLSRLVHADEIVVVLDRCNDQSKQIAGSFTNRLIEGSWPIEGDRRNTGLQACNGDWILEVDADERVPTQLFDQIRRTILTATPGYFLIPFDNYVGQTLVRNGWGGSWGVMAAPRLSSRGSKTWGSQRIHPSLTLVGEKRWLTVSIDHYVDRDLNDMLDRLKRYTDLRAADLLESGRKMPPMLWTMRRCVGRFLKCYLLRKGYKEGRWGLVIALMAALYPLVAHIKVDTARRSEGQS